MERDLIHERTVDGLAAAAAQGRHGGRPTKVDADTLAIAKARRARGESIPAIATFLKIGRSTLYRAMPAPDTDPVDASGTPA
jgi:DNA invertase Pin-like site-specific DNA recombinase